MESRLNDGLSLDLETMNLKIATTSELKQRIRREREADRQSLKETFSDPVKFRHMMENMEARFQNLRRIDAMEKELHSRPLSERICSSEEDFLLNTVKQMIPQVYDRLEILLSSYGDIDPMGICHIELKATDDKMLTESDLLGITHSENPEKTLCKIVDSKYSNAAKEFHDHIHKEITKDSALIEILKKAEIGNEELYQIVVNMIEMVPPYGYYYKQKIPVDITVNIGKRDAGYYTNLVFPHPEYEDEIPAKSCILWLVCQQGYHLNDLQNFRNKRPTINPFLSSVYNELKECFFPVNMLTFLVNITLNDYDRLKKAILAEKYYNHLRHPDQPHSNGYITLSSETTCGFLDFWNGLASAMEIKLEKNVVLPIRRIGSAKYDEQHSFTGRYILKETSAQWTDDAILEIQKTDPLPQN